MSFMKRGDMKKAVAESKAKSAAKPKAVKKSIYLERREQSASESESESDGEPNYGEEEEAEEATKTSSEEVGGLSVLERAAHEESIKQLIDMFPDWKHDDMEALFSSCGDKVDATVEAIMELGEKGAKAMSALASTKAAAPGAQVLDLGQGMSRTQLDDYERHVITGSDETMTIALTVPEGASPGNIIKVRMVDGSEYNVQIPPGTGPGSKFLAVFPTAPMREAAARRLGLAPAGADQGYFGHEAGYEDDDEMAMALAASMADQDELDKKKQKEGTSGKD